MRIDHRQTIEAALGRLSGIRPLSGGCVAEVYAARAADHPVVIKVDSGPTPALDIEAFMLQYLATESELPVPAVLHSEPSILVMDYIENDGRGGRRGEEEAADALAALHGIKAPRFGLHRDTLIGSLPQPNPQITSWPRFFAEARLLPMTRRCIDAGRLDKKTGRRLERLAQDLDDHLPHSVTPALLHGDVWSGNVLFHQGRLAALIDPAIYHGDPEVELAFITLFHTFGDPFFDRYAHHRTIAPEFFDHRRHVYNLYPLLVHVCLFGDSYIAQVQRALHRIGV